MTVVDAGMEGDGTRLESSGPNGPATDSLTGPIGPNRAAVTFEIANVLTQ